MTGQRAQVPATCSPYLFKSSCEINHCIVYCLTTVCRALKPFSPSASALGLIVVLVIRLCEIVLYIC